MVGIFSLPLVRDIADGANAQVDFRWTRVSLTLTMLTSADPMLVKIRRTPSKGTVLVPASPSEICMT